VRVEFLTSFADGPFDFIGGTVRDLPDPLPPRFLAYLRDGLIKPVKALGADTALEPAAAEYAIARRSRRSPRNRKPRDASEFP
jgi:hypothetical protein